MTGAAARHVQTSMFPDLVPHRARGWIMPSVYAGTNADLLAAVAPLYLHDRTVLDVTYGEGAWWRRWRPHDLTTHDLELDGVDFRDLPHPDGTFGAVCFDPPYVPKSGSQPPTAARFRERYGISNRSLTQLLALIAGGLDEACRVVRPGGFVLVKCCDFTANRKLQLGHRFVIDHAEGLGMIVHDLIIHHTGTGPGGHEIETPIRARRHHSYLVVLRRPLRTGQRTNGAAS